MKAVAGYFMSIVLDHLRDPRLLVSYFASYEKRSPTPRTKKIKQLADIGVYTLKVADIHSSFNIDSETGLQYGSPTF